MHVDGMERRGATSATHLAARLVAAVLLVPADLSIVEDPRVGAVFHHARRRGMSTALIEGLAVMVVRARRRAHVAVTGDDLTLLSWEGVSADLAASGFAEPALSHRCIVLLRQLGRALSPTPDDQLTLAIEQTIKEWDEEVVALWLVHVYLRLISTIASFDPDVGIRQLLTPDCCASDIRATSAGERR